MSEQIQITEQDRATLRKLAKHTAKDKKVEIITAKDGTIICYEASTKRNEIIRVDP